MARRRTEITTTASMDGLRANYRMAKTNRYIRQPRGLSPMGASADASFKSESDRLRMIERARDFVRNEDVASAIVRRMTDEVVQGGFTLDADTGDAGLDTEIQDRFHAWADDPYACDVQGRRTFAQMERAAYSGALVDGDIIGLGTKGGQIQLVEAHRCQTPQNTNRLVVHGVLINAFRKHLEYWFTKDNLDPTRVVAKVSDTTPIKTISPEGIQQVFLLANLNRVSQTRGVTCFAPVAEAVGQQGDIRFAELMKQQIASCVVFMSQLDVNANPTGNHSAWGANSNETLSDGTTGVVENIQPGLHIKGSPGEILSAFTPNIPGANFEPHIKMTLMLFSIAVGCPLVVLLMDGSETNFSGWRGAVDTARRNWRAAQFAQAAQFESPIYRWWLSQQIARDPKFAAALGKRKVKNPTGHKWQFPTWGYIEPLKDANADVVRLTSGLISPRRLHAERGRVADDIARETVEDNSSAIIRAKTAAAEINAQFPDDAPIHWRELLSLPAPDGVTVSIGQTDGGNSNGSTNDSA